MLSLKWQVHIVKADFIRNVQGGGYFGPGGFREMRGYPKKVESGKLSRDAVITEEL